TASGVTYWQGFADWLALFVLPFWGLSLGFLGWANETKRRLLEGCQLTIRGLEGRLDALRRQRDFDRDVYRELDTVLGEGKREWERTFDSIAELIVVIDEGGRILRCNRSFVQQLGGSFQTVVGRDLASVLSNNPDCAFPALSAGEVDIPALHGTFDVSIEVIPRSQGEAVKRALSVCCGTLPIANRRKSSWRIRSTSAMRLRSTVRRPLR
ncbi:MAG: PAS domain-containing protein, partial [Gammaproteobacteria bacterium]|nr:PAS domain-containing protein [Gammaproteobacteria bacterium]